VGFLNLALLIRQLAAIRSLLEFFKNVVQEILFAGGNLAVLDILPFRQQVGVFGLVQEIH
jgi:hypothetical protein